MGDDEMTTRQKDVMQFLDQYRALERKNCDAISWIALKLSISLDEAMREIDHAMDAKKREDRLA